MSRGDLVSVVHYLRALDREEVSLDRAHYFLFYHSTCLSIYSGDRVSSTMPIE